jgi:hypothetical protein
MVLARGVANIAHQLFGWHTGWRRAGFLDHLHSPWGYDEPEILRTSSRQFVDLSRFCAAPLITYCAAKGMNHGHRQDG